VNYEGNDQCRFRCGCRPCFGWSAVSVFCCCPRACFLADTPLGIGVYGAQHPIRIRFEARESVAQHCRSRVVVGRVCQPVVSCASWGLVLAGIALFLSLEVYVLHSERGTLGAPSTRQDSLAPMKGPFPLPRLVLNLRGPFLQYYPGYELGDIAVGRQLDLQVFVHNISIIPSSGQLWRSTVDLGP